MKHFIIGGAAIVAAAMAHQAIAAEPFKVAIIDQQAVIERSVAGKRALEEMKSYSATRQRIVEADDQELKDLEKAAQDPTLSEEAKKEKQDQFRTKLEAYQRRIQEFNREVQEKQRSMIAEYSKKIREAALVIAQKEGYTAVIDKGSEGAVKIVMYYHPSVDLTDKVVKELDRQNK
jgi:outer membrane protein